DALRYYPDLHASDIRFVLVDGAPFIFPELTEDQRAYVLAQLRERGVEVKLETFLNSAEHGVIKTSDGDEFESDLLVWNAGVKPAPVLSDSEVSDLPVVTERGPVMGKLEALGDLRVNGADGPLDNVFAAGDCAAVPDLASGDGKFCPPNAQHAVRQAKRLADNIARSVQGRPLEDYYHRNRGVMATLGMYKGVGRLQLGEKEIDIRGLPAWLMARSYHVYAMPTLGRKASVIAGWATNLISRRDIIGIPQAETPRAAFEYAANAGKKKGAPPGARTEQGAPGRLVRTLPRTSCAAASVREDRTGPGRGELPGAAPASPAMVISCDRVCSEISQNTQERSSVRHGAASGQKGRSAWRYTSWRTPRPARAPSRTSSPGPSGRPGTPVRSWAWPPGPRRCRPTPS